MKQDIHNCNSFTEIKDSKSVDNSQYYRPVARAITRFCKQNQSFAEIYNEKETPANIS